MATGKRELIDTGTDKRYVRRDEKGRFDEVVDVGRRKRHAENESKPGRAIGATGNAEHLLRTGVRRRLRTNAPLGETCGFRLRA
ncbi:MAG: hypothetical protein ACJ8DH_05550 [Microvirga sp.]